MQKILRNTYSFPPDTDRYTIYLLQEACKIFQYMTPGEVVEMVTGKDFQDSWKRAQEKTSSSHSELHFGLYMASSKSDKLSLLHAAKLTLASKLGIPLNRWSNDITVLLEKTFGAMLIDQLHTIWLFEADYNWLMKIIFAKRMMNNAHKKGLIPDEHFARSGSQASEGALVKVLMNDRTRILHVISAVSSCDLDQCYDREAHAIAAIALQAFGISVIMVGLMLKVLQRMKYYLRSGFGDAVAPSFQETEETPFFGFGQGNGAAPSSFQVLATLIMNAYIGLGHNVIMKSAITGALFSLAAVMYVDDTDLFQAAKCRYMTDKEFLAQVQQSVTDCGEASSGNRRCSSAKEMLVVSTFLHLSWASRDIKQLLNFQRHHLSLLILNSQELVFRT